MRAILLAAVLAVGSVAPALAQAGPAGAPVDPARLAAARALVDAAMPPAQRDTMMQAILKATMANVQQGMSGNPEFTKVLGDDPRMRGVFDRFMTRLSEDTIASVTAAMPGLMDAMATAYARQFTVTQLNEVRDFYRTPTGRDFIAKLPQVMADPAVAQAQQSMMAAQMARVPKLTAELTEEIVRLKGGK